MNRPDRGRAIEAARLLNEFVGDLVVGTRTLDLLEAPNIKSIVTDAFRTTMTRMCVSHLVVTLSKWQELYDRYKALIPSDVREACRDLRKELERRDVRGFRNKAAGHIWDSDTKRPISGSEVDSRLATIYDGNFEHFLLWINDPDSNQFPHNVVAIVEHVRNRLRAEFNITDADLFSDPIRP